MDFPTIEEAPAAAPAPQSAAVEQTRAISAGIVQVQGEVAKFDQIALGLAAIEAEHPKNVIVAAIDTPAGMKAAETAWRAYRNPRLEVERARKAAKAPVLALGRAIDEFAGGLEDRLREGETHYKAQIDREEERREAIRQEQARIEREAQQRHAARLETIAGYLTRCQEFGMTAERIARGMQMLTDSDVSDADAARAEALAGAKARALEQMGVLHAQAVAREAEAARQEAIRAENERVARELAEARAKLEAEAAAVRRQAEELAAAEQRAREQEAARIAAAQAESERLERLAEQNRARAAAAEAEAARQAAAAVAAAAAPAPATVKDSLTHASAPTPAPLLQDQSRPLTDALASKPDAMSNAREAVAAIQRADEPATLKLGVICERLGVTLTAAFLGDTLHIKPAKTDGRAVLFRESQFPVICRQLQSHISAMAELYAGEVA